MLERSTSHIGKAVQQSLCAPVYIDALSSQIAEMITLVSTQHISHRHVSFIGVRLTGMHLS
jgi:hypothetical protein